MRVLLLGNGGREHAIAWKILQSNELTQLYVAPGNAGTSTIAENVALNPNDFEAVKNFILEKEIEMLVVGPEDPLVLGIRDYLEKEEQLKDLMIVGPGEEGAKLEGSKDYAKEFMIRHQIPTAGFITVTPSNVDEGVEFLKKMNPPYVLKADGLAAGKGVLIIDSEEEAVAELKMMLEGKFGKASSKVVIEEYLKGIEISVFVLTDGNDYKILGSAKDYKRIGEGDAGLNTGGMGAVSPVPFADEEFNRKVEETIIRPTIKGLKKDGTDYKGFIFFGLMNVDGHPKVIEYNVRMGDPETEVIMPRMENDILSLFKAMAEGRLSTVPFKMKSEVCVTVMLVSAGYPGDYEKGKEITIQGIEDSMVFHAGTKNEGNKIVTNGGRVIAVSSFGPNIQKALDISYKNIGNIVFDGMYYRKDIGKDLIP